MDLLLGELHKSWSGMGLDFELLLPDDNELIEERADALGAWCGSFLVGLGLSGEISKDRNLSEDVRRPEDLSEIARIEVVRMKPLKKHSRTSVNMGGWPLLVATELPGYQHKGADKATVH